MPQIVSLLPGNEPWELAANVAMSGVRVSIENTIGALYERCPILFREFQISKEPYQEIFEVAVLLYNISVCVTRSPGSSSRFGVPPPLLDEYLSMD